MAKYRVHLVAVAETSVEVEAESGDEAVEVALWNAPAGANISNDFDMSEWTTTSEVWPDQDPEKDYELIEENN